MGALYKGIAFGFKFDKKRLLDIPFDEFDITVEDVLVAVIIIIIIIIMSLLPSKAHTT